GPPPSRRRRAAGPGSNRARKARSRSCANRRATSSARRGGAMNIAILGGTGKEGGGLATRWALVGHSIIIGSRDPERAKTKAAELREHTHKLPISGECNAEAARLGTAIVIAMPAHGLAATLSE